LGARQIKLFFKNYFSSSKKDDKVKIKGSKFSLSRAKFYLAGIGIAALLWVIVTLIFNFLTVEDVVPTPEIPEKSNEADIQLQKIHYTSTNDKGVKEWELKALSANYFQDKDLIEFEDVKVIYYSEKGKVFTLRGDNGLLNIKTKDIQLSGNVIGTSNDGYRFRTESLVYKADKHQAKTDDKVFLEGPYFDLEGWGMIMDVEKEKVSLLNDVRAKEKKWSSREDKD
jgi:LPS export ABC transporter protein LptC